MSSVVYFMAFHFPFWAIPTAYIFFELGNGFRRRGHMLKAIFILAISISFLGLTGAFFWYDGFHTVTPFVKKIELTYFS